MTNKYEEFNKRFMVQIQAYAYQDFKLDCNGNSCYLKYDVYGETSEVKLFSKRTGDELVYIETSTEKNITNFWIDKFEQFHYDESAFLAFLKETMKEPDEVFY